MATAPTVASPSSCEPLGFSDARRLRHQSIDPDDPLSGLGVGDRPDPEPPEGWTTVTVKAASLNHHDLWSLRGVGLRPGPAADDPRL